MIKQLIFLFALVALSSCEKEEDNSNAISEQNNQLMKWCLVEFRPGFGPTDSYSNCEIEWDFKSNDSIEVSINTTSVSDRLPMNHSGTYHYLFNSLNSTVTIEGVEYDVNMNTGSLEISDNPAADGPQLIFMAAP